MDINSLLTKTTEEVTAYIEQHLESDECRNINWLGIAQGCATIAGSPAAGSEETGKQWASISVRVYRKLREIESSQGIVESLQRSEMHLRSLFVIKYGDDPHSPIFNLDSIANWFLDDVQDTPSDVHQAATVWRQLPIDDIRKLRRLKNRISVLRNLEENDFLTNYPTLQPWLKLWHILP